MAADSIIRPLRAYTVNGHGLDGRVINYRSFWQWLAGLTPQQRQSARGGDIVAFANVHEEDGVWFMRVLQGRQGELPLFFNTATGDEREGEVGRNEVLAGAATFAFDPETRFIVVERRRPAVNVNEVARALGRIAREQGFDPRATFSLTPVVRPEGFEDELSEFETIKEVDVVVARPNTTWDDNASFLTDLAAESNASRAELSMTANRGESIARNSGIIEQIRDLIRDGRTPVQDVVLRGRRRGASKDSRARLGKHAETAEVALSRTLTQGREARVREGTRSFLDRLRERYGAGDD